ncbi:MAG TPA: rod shape-determining protein MreC [Noviherbaspirillum sp.]|uniref:rod shape-determining protein MreC n=1 Tax=Noviherbaspirillum sp. TaxID=1926288 RepID=UPI002D24F8A5|nr:rod shape-determining protein MreC [Noviherbaspirillum sp.]HYD97498.1 rod shape-determining protein MreC [Noviherbaspirillum sp.]
MDYSPPPLFKQGASARAKVVFFSLIALILLVADSRLRSLGAIRQVVGTVLYPLQVVALLPRDAAYMVGDYFSSLSAMQKENRGLKEQQIANGHTLQQVQQLSAENAHLRKLLSANERLAVKSVMTEILYDARDAFTRKIIVDRGTSHGVAQGQPVIDDVGVVGQVTRVFPFTAEVTLLTDKDQAIPVQVVRSGLRSIAYGQGHSGALDLRFMPANADIENGDMLVTSGIDGVYPAGLSVAKVTQVDRKSSDAFARIVCQPLAGIDRNRQLLILLTEMNFPPRPAPEDPKKEKAAKREAAKEAAKQPAAGTAATAAAAAAQQVPAAAIPANGPAAVTPTAAAAPASDKPATPAPAAPAAAKPSPAAAVPAAATQKPSADKPAAAKPAAAQPAAGQPAAGQPAAAQPAAAQPAAAAAPRPAPAALAKPAAATPPKPAATPAAAPAAAPAAPQGVTP